MVLGGPVMTRMLAAGTPTAIRRRPRFGTSFPPSPLPTARRGSLPAPTPAYTTIEWLGSPERVITGRVFASADTDTSTTGTPAARDDIRSWLPFQNAHTLAATEYGSTFLVLADGGGISVFRRSLGGIGRGCRRGTLR